MLGEIKSVPTFNSELGSLAVIEALSHVPFEIKRVYYLHGVPDHVVRGGHAHKKLQQFLVAVHGSLSVKLHNGNEEFTHNLRDPSKGLYLPSGLWRDLFNFSEGAVCLVLASEHFSEEDYIRDFSDFLTWKKA